MIITLTVEALSLWVLPNRKATKYLTVVKTSYHYTVDPYEQEIDIDHQTGVGTLEVATHSV